MKVNLKMLADTLETKADQITASEIFMASIFH